MALTTMESMERGMVRVIQEEADRLREEAIQKSVLDYEKQLREAIAKRAIDVSSYYAIARREEGLVITVKHMDRP